MVLAGTTLGSAKDNVQNKKNDEPKKKVLTLKKNITEDDCGFVGYVMEQTPNGLVYVTMSSCTYPCGPFEKPGVTAALIIIKK
jgi:hypothetical protein